MVYLEQDQCRASQEMRILSYDCGPDKRLRPSAALRYLQEIADGHCRLFGLDYDTLVDRHAVFLLTQLSLRCTRWPELYEKGKLTTWSRGMKGIKFLRNSVMTALDGTALFSCASQWVLVHPENHRILRPREMPSYPVPSCAGEAPGDFLTGRLKLPREMEIVGIRPIRYTDLDFNGHVNNCVYADFILDFLPGGVAGKRLTGLDIRYLGEALLGDELELFAAQEGQKIYFSGRHGRGNCFEALSYWDF